MIRQRTVEEDLVLCIVRKSDCWFISSEPTANQDVQARTQKSSSILPITPFKKHARYIFRINMFRATKKQESFGKVNPKVEKMPHFKVEAVYKF